MSVQNAEHHWQRALIVIDRIHQIAVGGECPPGDGGMPLDQAGALDAYSSDDRVRLILDVISDYRESFNERDI